MCCFRHLHAATKDVHLTTLYKIISESPLAVQSSPSFSPSTLRGLAVMSGALMEDTASPPKARLGGNFLVGLINSAASPSVLPPGSSFPVPTIPESPADAPRSRKRARASSPPASRKKARPAENQCGCTMPLKCLEGLAEASQTKSVRSAKHLLSGLYYLGRQICRQHINQLRRLYELLSIEDPSEMKDVL